MSRQNCPNKANHTPQPDGYLEWHRWAEKMAASHKQVKCPTCGRLEIWVKKGSKETS